MTLLDQSQIKGVFDLSNYRKLILFGAGLILIFALMFHKEDQLKELFQLAKPDHISVLYLRLLLNITPEDENLRIELANQYVNLGQYDNARDELNYLILQNGHTAIHARLLLLEIDLSDYFLLSNHDINRKTALERLQADITEISRISIPVALFPKIIKLSLELNQPSIAADLYYQWAGIDNEVNGKFEKLKEAAHWYIAAGLPDKAAGIYHESYELTEDPALARQFALLTLQTLQSAGDSKLAIGYFHTYQQRFPEDAELLDEAIGISLRNNAPEQAYQLGSIRLALEPDNPDQIRKQYDRALAIGKTQQALVLTQHLIEILPHDESSHERLAQIAEWSQQPKLAVMEWLWLARNRKDTTAILNALRLAIQLNRHNITVEMLEQLSGVRELSKEEMNNLLYAYDNMHNLSSKR
ncbi:MAG TPA: hypothetical protein VK141_02550 [Nitrosomonas sp.]|nr:hypothetical protein [Nitrosomonas sp.]